jgi:Zn-dependent protease
MEPAVFRPVRHGQGKLILLGAAAGVALGLLAGIPPLLAVLFGAVAAAIAGSARHVSGVRLVASATHLEVQGRPEPFSARWDELRLAFGLTSRADGGEYQRYAVLADLQGRSVAFGAFAGHGPCQPGRGAGGRPVEVLDLEGAAVLLAVLVQRVPAWQVLPDWLAAPPAPLEAASTPAPAPPPGSPPSATSTPTNRVGLLALAAKLGGKLAGAVGKLGAGVLKAAKGTNLAMAAASAAAYSILFSWKFALLLLLQLVVHEYGHVHAMRRSGMRVKGMYLVPFFGAMTASEDAFSSRRQQAYVALSGPLWGGLATLLPLGAYFATGQGFWAAVAAWWAIINLFQLLPFSPLDGGRALSAFANSFSSNLGVAVGVLGLATMVALGTFMDFSLIWIVAALGAMELVGESRARSGGRALRLLPEPARFTALHYQHLRTVIGPPPSQVELLTSARDLVRMEQAARVEPMGKRQILGWGLLYVALAGGLLALVYFTSHLPGAAEAAQILT